MAGFDEMLALEEEAQCLELDIERAWDRIRDILQKRKDILQGTADLERGLELLRAQFKSMGAAKVVLLSEYERVKSFISTDEQSLVTNRQHVSVLEKNIAATEKQLPVLKARLEAVQLKLSNYCQVIPFRHP